MSIGPELDKRLFEEIKIYTLGVYPNEMCGIISEGRFVGFRNIAENPEKTFKFAAEELLPYIGKIDYICHSHTIEERKVETIDLRTPSLSDILQQEKTGIPWLIFGTNGKYVSSPVQIPRLKNPDFTHRPFIWFVNDCYSLVQDYYWFTYGIDLPNHCAKEDYKDLRKLNGIFDEYIDSYGWKKLPVTGHKWENGDLALLSQGGFEKNHLGIYENGQIIHQSTLIKREPVEAFFGHIHQVLRYENKNL